MFTSNKIEVALNELFDLCDFDDMEMMFENYAEEFEDICPDILALAFQSKAHMVPAYRVISIAGEGIDYMSRAIFKNRAVKILGYAVDSVGDEKVRTVQSKELWLQEDMTFSIVNCVVLIVGNDEDHICVTEYRSLIKNIEQEEDIFFDPSDLVCELDDICMFESLKVKAAMNEQ